MASNGGQDRGHRFEEIATTVRNRDRGRCRSCGDSEAGEKLGVHHLIADSDIPEGIDSHLPVNLVSLCRSCHANLESKSLQDQIRKLDIEDQSELMLSGDVREKLNNRLESVGPDILTAKKITRKESEVFLDRDFSTESVGSQTDLSQFQH